MSLSWQIPGTLVTLKGVSLGAQAWQQSDPQRHVVHFSIVRFVMAVLCCFGFLDTGSGDSSCTVLLT